MARTCLQTEQDYQTLLIDLTRSGVLEGWPSTKVTRCSACESGHGDACLGPELAMIDRLNPLCFVPAKFKKQTLRVELAELTTRNRGEAAVASHSLEIRIWRLETGAGGPTPVFRAHLDNRVPGAAEPLSHLHFGGCRWVDAVEDERWPLPSVTESLRWPVASSDVVLTAELVLASYFNNNWESLLGEVSFVGAVKRSEQDHILNRYIKAWQDEYAGSKVPSFLKVLMTG